MTRLSAEALRAELEELNAAFRERLVDDLASLEAQVAPLAMAGSTAPLPFESLLPALHQLVGSAGTFGELGVSTAARELELALRARRTDPAPLTAEERLSWAQQVAGLRRLRAAHEVVMASLPPGVRSTSTRRVDVLEDDPNIRGMMVKSLRNFGYVAEGFSDIAALRAAMTERRPDALVVDVHLGDDDGLALLEALQIEQSSPIPAMVVTTRDDFHHRLRAVRAGAVGFFAKPVDLPQLENRLELCFDDFRGEPYRVVAVDDDPLILARYAAVLGRAGIYVHTLSEPDALADAMSTVVPDLLLLDMEMPTCSGAELAQMVRFDERWVGLPIIYLSAESDLSRQSAALVRGGDEFITKPVADDMLVVTVLSRARRARALSNALSRDSLTGLLKHGSAKEQLEQSISRARRAGKPCAVAMIDLDHFKNVNDQHGHATGDKVLRAVGNLLKNSLRKDDIVGRYGGEEFIAVLNGLNAADAAAKLDRLRQQFSEIAFQSGTVDFHVTFSVGVSDSTRFVNAADVLVDADQALYRAKSQGRNQTCWQSV